MPRPRSAMRKVREVLRLTLGERLTRRQVAAALGMPPTTVTDYVARALAAGLRWPLPEGLDDAELEARLFVQAATLQVLRVTAPAPLPGAVRVGLITTYYNTRICRPHRTHGGAAVDPHVARASRLIRSSWGTPIWPNQMRLSRHPPSTERAHAAIRCTLVVPHSWAMRWPARAASSPLLPPPRRPVPHLVRALSAPRGPINHPAPRGVDRRRPRRLQPEHRRSAGAREVWRHARDGGPRCSGPASGSR